MMTEAQIRETLEMWKQSAATADLTRDVDASKLAHTYVNALEMVLR